PTPAPEVGALVAPEPTAPPSEADGRAQVEATEAAPAQDVGGERVTVPAGPVYALTGVSAFRQRLAGYPWRVWALASGALVIVLLALTLRLRAVRARWP
ncbi:MAG: hypothetical protein QME94_19280, partial [Anaerolineae bacterium]|nr:hypothetical protein [Anaerolineae bacterium]